MACPRFSPVAGIKCVDRGLSLNEIRHNYSFSPVAGIKCVDRQRPQTIPRRWRKVSVPLPGLSVLIAYGDRRKYLGIEVSVPLPGLSVLIAMWEPIEFTNSNGQFQSRCRD